MLQYRRSITRGTALGSLLIAALATAGPEDADAGRGFALASACTAEHAARLAAEDVLTSVATPDDESGTVSTPSDLTLEQVKERRLARVIIRPSKVRRETVAPAPAPRDPTLISVPSNTLGPGEPLWFRREREAVELRHLEAQTEIAERDAARPSYAETWYGESYDGVVVYGPHAPRWVGRGWYRPGVEFDTGERGLVKELHGPGAHASQTTEPTDDVIDRAQIEFGRIAYPKIGPIVEPQLEAQRRFGRNATPPIIEIQRRTDEAQLRTRKQAPLPN